MSLTDEQVRDSLEAIRADQRVSRSQDKKTRATLDKVVDSVQEIRENAAANRAEMKNLSSAIIKLDSTLENSAKQATEAVRLSHQNEKRLDKNDDTNALLQEMIARHGERFEAQDKSHRKASFWESSNGKIALYIGLAIVVGLTGLAGYNIAFPAL